MAFRLEEVKDPKDFDEIIPMLYDAFEEPHNALRRWFMPVLTTVEDAIKLKVQKTVKNNLADHVHWLKVTHIETGQIIGAALWEIRQTIDGIGEPQQPIDAVWFPEGSEERMFASRLMTSLRGFMKERMGRPHAELEQLVVAKDYRQQGVARLLVEWGKHQADKLGIESCVESVPFAVSSYEKLGYGSIDCLHPDVALSQPSDKYKGYMDDDLRVFILWRPVGHDFDSSIDQVPWK
ncbi:hypothetical protein F5Y18DRAFT_423738 [Xylariaceae sp. FL1019]|nr:hypothetical protein F5Y18DRAFT_423738 [Xylariaceae sp. FL1019]